MLAWKSKDAVIGLDSSDRIGLWSQGASTLLGVDAEGAQGRPILELLPELGPVLADAEATGSIFPGVMN